MTDTVLLVRGNTPDERHRSIDTICMWLRDLNATAIDPGTVREMYDWTETNATTMCHMSNDDDAYLYVKPGKDTARDRQGPDKPGPTALTQAAGGDAPSNFVVDSLANAPTDAIEEAVCEFRVRVHDATHALTLNPTHRDRDAFPPATRRAIEVLTGTADHADALLAGIEWGGGRPPLGCTSNDGRLAPGDDYDRVCRVLQQVADDKTSKSRAADRLGCARKTIDNALDRPELYRLE